MYENMQITKDYSNKNKFKNEWNFLIEQIQK